MDTKYIFLDIDGTLVDFDCTMPESARAALTAAQKNGHKLMLSTGRFYGQIYPWLLDAVHFDGLIMSSGANIVYGGERIYVKHFSRDQLAHLEECFNKAGACSCRQLESGLVSTESDYARMCAMLVDAGVSRESIKSLHGDVTMADMTALGGVEKVIYYGASLELEDMRRLLGAEFNIDPFSFKNMPATCGEVNLAGISKGNAIKMMMAHIGADMRDTIAIGDGGNDITMIREAGIGVAMGNASDDIKAAADMITDPIDKDGIYNAFVLLGLI